MALGFLSACRLKSLRMDNGRSAKITLSGLGRARFLSPYPRPGPSSSSSLGLLGPGSRGSAGLIPTHLACTCTSEPRAPPRPQCFPKPTRPGLHGYHRASQQGQCRQRSSHPGNAAWEGVCEHSPNATSVPHGRMPGSCVTLPPSLHSGVSFC